MAGNYSRGKGNRGETEVLRILQEVVDGVVEETGHPHVVIRKNRDQRYSPKQYDLIGLPWLAVEVKYQEDWSGLGSWWRQVVDACGPGQAPVLFYRKNYHKWRIRMRVPVVVSKGVRVRMTVTTDESSFRVWLRELLKIQWNTENPFAG